MIAARLKVGSPKRNGVVTPSQPCFRNPAEVNKSKRCGDSRADDQPEKDGDAAHKTTGKPINHEY